MQNIMDSKINPITYPTPDSKPGLGYSATEASNRFAQDDCAGQMPMGQREMTDEEKTAAYNALPIEAKIEQLRLDLINLGHLNQQLFEMNRELAMQARRLRNQFTNHTHSHNGMGAAVIPVSEY